MINEVFIPKTCLNVEDCRFIAWLADEGARVEAGQAIFSMETEKVEMDVEADDAGYLHRRATPEVDYPVGAVIGYIASTEDEYRSLLA